MPTKEATFKYILEAQYSGSAEMRKFQNDLKMIGRIESLKKLGTDYQRLAKEFRAAKGDLEKQAADIRKSGDASKKTAKAYEIAQKNVKKLAVQVERSSKAYKKSKKEIEAGGVATKNLNVEVKKLTKSTEEYQKISEIRSKLGLKGIQNTNEEIKKLTESYEYLKKSGTASVEDLAKAKETLNLKIKKLTVTSKNFREEIAKSVLGMAQLAASGAGIAYSFQEFSRFETGMAKVYTLVDITADRFGRLKKDLRELGKDFSRPTAELTEGLYNIVSAGVSLDDSLDVLDESAEAATAGLSTVNTAATLGISVLNSYGMSANRINEVYNIVFKTMKRGVTTFDQLGEHMGEILPIAKAANVGFNEVGASIALMTKTGLATPKAATALQGAIRAMAAPAPDAKKKMEEMGIVYKGLIPTLEQIREKGLSLAGMRDIVPDVEAQVGVQILTENLDGLKDILGEIDSESDAVGEAYKKIAATPAEKVGKLNKAVSGLAISVGALLSEGILPLVEGLTGAVHWINEASIGTQALVGFVIAGGGALVAWNLGLGRVVKALKLYQLESKASVFWTQVLNKELSKSDIGLKNIKSTLGKMLLAFVAFQAGWEFGSWLNREFESVRQVAQLSIGQVILLVQKLGKNFLMLKRARDKMWGLSTEMEDKLIASLEKQIASTEKTIKLVKNERLGYDKLKKAGVDAANKIAENSAKKKEEELRAFNIQMEEMEARYKEYIDKRAELLDKITKRERSLAEELRAMGREGMSDIDAWQDRYAEAEEYYTMAQKALVEAQDAIKAGDEAAAGMAFEKAIGYADDAKDAYKELHREVKDGEQTIWTAQQTLQFSMENVESAGQLAIDILKKQEKAAVDAADAMDVEAKGAFSKKYLKETQGEVQNLETEIIKVGDTWINVWKDSTEAAKKEFKTVEGLIDELVKQRIIPIEVQITETEKKKLGGTVGKQQLSNGGAVLAMRGLQHLAGGGPVWKNILGGGALPGYGGGDKVRAMLEAGEVVLNKESVQEGSKKAALAFNAKRWDIVLSEMLKKTQALPFVGANTGGFLKSFNSIQVESPPLLQHLQAGGSVMSAAGGGGETVNIKLELMPDRPAINLLGNRYNVDQLQRQLSEIGRLKR